jgi:hypothetical protein
MSDETAPKPAVSWFTYTMGQPSVGWLEYRYNETVTTHEKRFGALHGGKFRPRPPLVLMA